MCVKVLNGLGIIITFIGTYYTVHNVIKMNNKIIEKSFTAGYRDDENGVRTNDLKLQRKYTKIGLGCILLGSVLQFISLFL